MRRRLTIALLCAGIAPLCSAQSQSRTPVEVAGFKRMREEDYSLSMRVFGGTTLSQPVVLLRTTKRFGLRVATDRQDQAVQPRTMDKLPPPWPQSSPSPQRSVSLWNVEFHSSTAWGEVAEIFVVVCEVRERPEWTRERDYKGFGYLPFNKTQNIEEALVVLKDFGWLPTGFTRIAP